MPDSTKIIGDIAGVPNPKSDWAQNDERKADYIKNKPDLDVFSNALKGTASGEVVSITDVSPIEHNVAVKLSSDAITDFSTVNVNAYGKNLINADNFVNAQFVKNDDGSYTFTKTSSSNRSTKYIKTSDVIPVGKKIYFSINSVEGTASGLVVQIHYKDDSYVSWGNITPTKKTLSLTLTKEILEIRLYFNQTEADGAYLNISGIQFGVDADTSYEPYKEPITYTPNADGTVEGVKSIYPNMTLMPSEQGVLVECEYNRDLNKAFEEITNAIIALGGNI